MLLDVCLNTTIVRRALRSRTKANLRPHLLAMPTCTRQSTSAKNLLSRWEEEALILGAVFACHYPSLRGRLGGSFPSALGSASVSGFLEYSRIET